VIDFKVESVYCAVRTEELLYKTDNSRLEKVKAQSTNVIELKNIRWNEKEAMQRVRFTQPYCWTITCSGILRHVVWQVVTDVRKKRGAFIFNVKWSKTTGQTAWCDSPENVQLLVFNSAKYMKYGAPAYPDWGISGLSAWVWQA